MVSPRGCGDAILYVVVTDFPGFPTEGIEEWVVKVPMKTGLMASCKTNNYLLNALTAMESQVRSPRPRPHPAYHSCFLLMHVSTSMHLEPCAGNRRRTDNSSCATYGHVTDTNRQFLLFSVCSPPISG